MKKYLKFSLASVALCALALIPVRAANLADTSVTPRIVNLCTSQLVTNGASIVNVGTNTLYEAFSYTHDMTVFITSWSTNNQVAAVTVSNQFDLSLDGTNFSTTLPLAANFVAGTLTTTNRYVSVIPKTSFDGCKAVRLTYINPPALGTGTNLFVTVQLGIVP